MSFDSCITSLLEKQKNKNEDGYIEKEHLLNIEKEHEKILVTNIYDTNSTIFDEYCFTKTKLIEIDIEEPFKIIFSPDSSKIAYLSKNRSIKVFDINTHEVIGCFHPFINKDQINDIIYHPNGKNILSKSTTGFQVWDIDNQDKFKLIKMKNSPLSFGLTPNGETLIIYSRDGFFIYDFKTGKLLKHYPNLHTNLPIKYLNDEQIMIMVLNDEDVNKGNLIILNFLTEKYDKIIPLKNPNIIVDFFPLDTKIEKIIFINNGKIALYNIKTDSIDEFENNFDDIQKRNRNSIQFLNKTIFLYIHYFHAAIVIRNIARYTRDMFNFSEVNNLQISPNKKMLVSVSFGKLNIYEILILDAKYAGMKK
jgi:WD40 repeat protein